MAKKKEDTDIIELKRQITSHHVTMGLLRGALSQLDEAVASKDKEKFKDAIRKLHAHLDRTQ